MKEKEGTELFFHYLDHIGSTQSQKLYIISKSHKGTVMQIEKH